MNSQQMAAWVTMTVTFAAIVVAIYFGLVPGIEATYRDWFSATVFAVIVASIALILKWWVPRNIGKDGRFIGSIFRRRKKDRP